MKSIAILSPYSAELFPLRNISTHKNKFFRATWTENLIRILKTNTHMDIHLITISKFINRNEIFEDDGVWYHYLKQPISFAGWLSLLFFSPFTLLNEIRKVNPDLIHIQGTENCYGIIAILTKRKTILSLHAVVESVVNIKECCLKPKQWPLMLLPLINKYAIRRADLIHTQTNYLKEVYHKFINDKRIFVHDWPVNPEFLKVKNMPKKNSILFVAVELYIKRWGHGT